MTTTPPPHFEESIDSLVRTWSLIEDDLPADHPLAGVSASRRRQVLQVAARIWISRAMAGAALTVKANTQGPKKPVASLTRSEPRPVLDIVADGYGLLPLDDDTADLVMVLVATRGWLDREELGDVIQTAKAVLAGP